MPWLNLGEVSKLFDGIFGLGMWLRVGFVEGFVKWFLILVGKMGIG